LRLPRRIVSSRRVETGSRAGYFFDEKRTVKLTYEIQCRPERSAFNRMRPAFGYRCGDITDFADFYCAVTIKTNGAPLCLVPSKRKTKRKYAAEFDSWHVV